MLMGIAQASARMGESVNYASVGILSNTTERIDVGKHQQEFEGHDHK
jgi:hypothetical protein